MLDGAQYERPLAAAESELKPFVGRDGSVAFEMPALIVSGRTP